MRKQTIASALFVFKTKEDSAEVGRKLGLTVIGKTLSEVERFYKNGPRGLGISIVPQLYKKGIYLLWNKDELDKHGNQSVLEHQSSVFGIYLIAPFDPNHLRNFLAYLYHDNNYNYYVAMGFGESVILERYFGEGALRILKNYKRQKQGQR